MNIKFEVFPMIEKEDKWLRMRLTFLSNINFTEFVTERIIYDCSGMDNRKRIIDEMFYELRQRITEADGAFDKLLEAMKGVK